jgi:patatin-like phospholipase/acyl hydrolase
VDGYFTIVSFCGGGIRGLMSAEILQRLAHASSNILTNTRLFAGTSTGSGIINLLLADYTPSRIIEYFLTQERDFFSHQSPEGASAPGYSIDEVFAGVIAVHDGNPSLNSFTTGKHPQFVLFTAFDVGSSAEDYWKPILYHNLPAGNQGTVGIADAVASSSAMPGMLGSWKRHVDGAFVNHDPTFSAMAVAIANGATLDKICVIDIGTGFMPNWIASDTHRWGAQQWQNGDGNPENHTPPLLINGTSSPILNLSLNGTSSTLNPMLLKMMLGSRYVNLNPRIPYIPENATSDAQIDTLRAAAAAVPIHDAVKLLQKAWSVAA